MDGGAQIPGCLGGKQENLKFVFVAYADAVGWRTVKPAGAFSAKLWGPRVWVGDKDDEVTSVVSKPGPDSVLGLSVLWT